MSENKYATDKQGNKVYICNYRWQDSDGKIETCRAPKACEICGQCSRLVGDHESGHCPGHLGLSEHIKVPGSDQDAAKAKLENARTNQPRRVGQKPKQNRRPDKRQVKVEHKPRLGKQA